MINTARRRAVAHLTHPSLIELIGVRCFNGEGEGGGGGGNGSGSGSGEGSGGSGNSSGSGSGGSGGSNTGGSGGSNTGGSGGSNTGGSGGSNTGGSGSGGSGGNAGGGRGGDSPDRRRKLEDMSASELRTYVRELREENGDHRTRRTAAEEQNAQLLAGLANVLGLTSEGKPDPEKIAADLEAAGEKIKNLETELAVRRHAQDAGADANALLDSRSFMADVLGLDRAASDYGTKITDKIKTFVQENPRASSGTGGSGFQRGAIGQQSPGRDQAPSGVAAGRALRRERTERTRPPNHTTTTRRG